MTGLLYKDYVVVKGRIYIVGGLLIAALLLVLRLVLPTEIGDYTLPALVMEVTFVLYMVIVYRLEVSLLEADEGKKQKNYFLSLPVTKKQYVASKYIFLLIAFYITMSLGIIMSSICRINCSNEQFEEMLMMFMSMLPVITCAALLIPTLEMPFFIIWGSKKGGQIKVGLIMLIFFAIIVFLLFGDLTILDMISLVAFFEYLKAHQDILLIIQVLSPYISFILYYLSYRIAYMFFARKEWDND